jgi:hypothetical protein
VKKIAILVMSMIANICFGIEAVEIIDRESGRSLSIEANRSLPVNIQDQASKPVDYFFTKIEGVPTTVATNTAIDDYSVYVVSTNNCSVGGYLGLFNADDPADNRAYFGEILSISGTNVTLDTPIDFAFQVGDTAACFSRDLNVDGSATNQIFSVQVGSGASQSIDITRIMLHMETASAVSLAKFGDLPSLTNGIVLRKVDGTTFNIWNVKNNGEMKNLCYDWSPTLGSNPQQNVDGASFRYTFNGPEKHGVVVRLDPGDSLQLIIQDDLSGLTVFRVIAEGHFVVD